MRRLALQHRLRYRKGEDGTYIIPGKRGHIGEWGDGRLYWALVYDYSEGQPTGRLKKMAKKDPKLHLEVEGDEEAVFTFDQEDLHLIAKKWCQAGRIRRLSDERRKALIEAGQASRFENTRGKSA